MNYIIRVSGILAQKGKREILAGVDMDYLGQLFQIIAHLLSTSEFVTRMCTNPDAESVLWKEYKVMKRNSLFFIIFFLFILSDGYSQISVGSFRTHFSYRYASILANKQSKIYCASENGLFSFDTDDKSIRILSKLDGLSDGGVGAMKYFPDNDLFVIGYKNGNLDFVTDGKVFNNNSLKESSFPEERKYVYDVAENDLIYLSTGVGIVVIEPVNFNVRESYRQIGPAGEEITAFQTAFYQDSIFVATDLGVLYAPFNDQTNLVDFNSWNLFGDDDGLSEKSYRGILSHSLGLLAYDSLNVYIYNDGWKLFEYQPDERINRINNSANKLFINLESKIVIIDDGEISILDEGLRNPFFSMELNGEIWVADYGNGMIDTQNNFSRVLPNGPYSQENFRVVSDVNRVVVLAGGHDTGFNKWNSKSGFYVFSGNMWQNYNEDLGSFEDMYDLNSYTGTSDGEGYFASFGSGILKWTENEFITVDDSSPGSTLQRNDDGDLLVSGIQSDRNGNLWILNFDSDLPLHQWDGDDSWNAHSINAPGARFPSNLELTDYGDIWMAVDPNNNGGIVVYDPETNTSRKLTTSSGNGSLPNGSVNALLYDKQGRMWVGTRRGMVYFSEPYRVLERNGSNFVGINASLPIVENNVLLASETVNDLAMDAAGRIWIATNNGAWLVDFDSDEIQEIFNDKNSPLTSNQVHSIGIDQSSGEIFFATDKGTFSYRGDATLPENSFDRVKIFPNPVNPGYSGLVTISGLLDNSFIKITDIAGQLVYETRSFGGTATWNLATHSSRLSAGVYLVFMSDEEATEKMVGKFAIVK